MPWCHCAQTLIQLPPPPQSKSGHSFIQHSQKWMGPWYKTKNNSQSDVKQFNPRFIPRVHAYINTLAGVTWTWPYFNGDWPAPLETQQMNLKLLGGADLQRRMSSYLRCMYTGAGNPGQAWEWVKGSRLLLLTRELPLEVALGRTKSSG